MSAFDGILVVDVTRVGPGPHCTMLLGDLGASVVVVERPGAPAEGGEDAAAAARMATRRNKRSLQLDLKAPAGLEAFVRLADRADVIVEGNRPGVADRLGIGDAALRARNPRLVYCSISGYGQAGPYAGRAGHDIDYIAAAGALAMIGTPGGAPAVPMNFVADYGGGAVLAAFAIATALFVRERTGKGQFIDVAMTDGVISQLAKRYAEYVGDGVVPDPGRHRINGGLPWYGVYRAADGRWLAVGPLERHLFRNLCEGLGLPELADAHGDPSRHAEVRDAFTRRFAERPGAQWAELLADADACVELVRDLAEVEVDPHHCGREMFVEVDGVHQVGVVPKLESTPGAIRSVGRPAGADTDAILGELGYDAEAIAALRSQGVV